MAMKIWVAGDKVLASDLNENFVKTIYLLVGNGNDGNVTISSNTSLSRDMYYNNLTINNGITLNPNGYRIFVKGDLTCVGTGKIASNGATGTAGSNATSSNGASGGGATTPQYTTGTLPVPRSGEAGGAGGTTPNSGSAGSNGNNEVKCLTTNNSVAGGVGGDTIVAGVGGAGGIAASPSGTIYAKPNNFISAYNLFDLIGTTLTRFGIAPSSGGGGGGGGNLLNTAGGGGGGASGTSGGVVFICATNIVLLNAEAKGGTGGQGGNGHNNVGTYGGVGGGGGGGNGGVIILIYGSATTVNTDVTGGTGGAIGSVGLTNSATAGATGNAGLVYTITL